MNNIWKKITKKQAEYMLEFVPIKGLAFAIDQNPEEAIIEMWKEKGLIED